MTTIYSGSDLTTFLASYSNIGYINNNVDVVSNLKAQNSNKKLLSNASRKINIGKIFAPLDNDVDFDVSKDMSYAIYTYRYNPYSMQNTLFSSLADFVDENIVAGAIVSGTERGKSVADYERMFVLEAQTKNFTKLKLAID